MAFLNKLRSTKKSKGKLLEEVQPTTSEEKQLTSTVIQPDSSDSNNKMSSTLTEVHELTQPIESAEQSDKDKNGNVDSLPSSAELPDCFKAFKNLPTTFKEFFNQSSDDYKEIAKCCGLAIVSLIGLFISVVLLRFVRRVVFPDDAGWFCTYFAGPFCPLFDALCAEQESYVNELFKQVNIVSNDTYNTFNGFFKSVFDGFHALYTIFWAIFGGAIDTIFKGYAELQENMGENISHLSAVQNLLRDCPHFKPLVDTTDFLYINDNRLFNSVLVILVFTTFIIIFTLLGLIAYFGYLFKEKFRLCSETKRRLQYRLMLNSALSLMIPSFSHGIPALLGQALMLFKISSLQIWTSSLIWIIGSLHGILNCITFITLNDYYRSKFKKDVDTVVEAMRILSKSQVYSTS
ncbi:unnamed protein product [Auanema sp. JU1783]|nr:unnamed protein product [Auanema sp. JU1783]